MLDRLPLGIEAGSSLAPASEDETAGQSAAQLPAAGSGSNSFERARWERAVRLRRS